MACAAQLLRIGWSLVQILLDPPLNKRPAETWMISEESVFVGKFLLFHSADP